MKQIITTFVLLFLLISNFSFAQPGFGEAQKINDRWKFILKDLGDAKDENYNDGNWQNVDLPHDWSIRQLFSPTYASCMGYLPGGIGWYRKSIYIPADKSNQKIYLYFEGIYNRSEVYVNGHLIGKRPNGYVSFCYDISPYVKRGSDNLVAVRVDHSRSADSRWYTGSGIYRNVWLVYANPLHIAQWGVYAFPSKATAEKGTLQVQVRVSNDSDKPSKIIICNELIDPNGKVVAKSKKDLSVEAEGTSASEQMLAVKNPLLWSIRHPQLYTLKTTLLKDGKQIDMSVIKTGFRSLTFDPDKGFALNGDWMKVKGVCIHHDAGVLGAAVPKDVWRQRLLELKKIGCNAIRTSHNPQAPELYDLCDEMGFLLMDEAFDEWEFPKRKWIEGWNVGTPGFDGSSDFFEEWGEKDLADMIRRDRNHLSVFAWSIGNEVDYPNDPYSHPVLDGGANTGFTQPVFGGYKKDAPDARRLGDIAKRLVAVVKKYDTSRPTTAGLAGVAMSNQTEYPFVLDITGYNYTESMYDSDHKKYPQRVIFGSENRHELSAWKAVRDKEFIFGQFLWTGIDYLGESGRWPSRGFYSGLIDFAGFIKPRGYFRQSLWSDRPMSYLGTYPTPGKGGINRMSDVWSQHDAEQNSNYEEKTPSMDAWSIWNYQPGQMIRVVCYTNAAKAKLLLNDREVGAMQDYNQESGIIYWDIPFEAGALKVVGMNSENQPVSSYEIKTSQRPFALKIIQDEVRFDPEESVARIALQVVDENNIPVMISDDEITCHLSPNARLLGMEAANNADMSDYTDNIQRAYHGRIVAYLKLTDSTSDKINVKFTSPWLKQAETNIKVR